MPGTPCCCRATRSRVLRMVTAGASACEDAAEEGAPGRNTRGCGLRHDSARGETGPGGISYNAGVCAWVCGGVAGRAGRRRCGQPVRGQEVCVRYPVQGSRDVNPVALRCDGGRPTYGLGPVRGREVCEVSKKGIPCRAAPACRRGKTEAPAADLRKPSQRRSVGRSAQELIF